MTYQTQSVPPQSVPPQSQSTGAQAQGDQAQTKPPANADSQVLQFVWNKTNGLQSLQPDELMGLLYGCLDSLDDWYGYAGEPPLEIKQSLGYLSLDGNLNLIAHILKHLRSHYPVTSYPVTAPVQPAPSHHVPRS